MRFVRVAGLLACAVALAGCAGQEPTSLPVARAADAGAATTEGAGSASADPAGAAALPDGGTSPAATSHAATTATARTAGPASPTASTRPTPPPVPSSRTGSPATSRTTSATRGTSAGPAPGTTAPRTSSAAGTDGGFHVLPPRIALVGGDLQVTFLSAYRPADALTYKDVRCEFTFYSTVEDPEMPATMHGGAFGRGARWTPVKGAMYWAEETCPGDPRTSKAESQPLTVPA